MDEIWRDVNGFEGYQVSNYGNIIGRRYKDRYVAPVEDKDGYHKIRFMLNGRRTKRSLHRIVTLAFIENPNNYPTVNHIDGNKQNNIVTNLEWASWQQNNQHAHDTGLNPGGDQHWKARKIRIEDTFTNTTYDYTCMKYVIQYFSITKSTILNNIDSEKLAFKRYKISYLSNDYPINIANINRVTFNDYRASE